MILIKSKYFEGLKLDRNEPDNERRVKEFLLKLPPETEITITTRFGIEIETLKIEDLYSK